MPEYSVFSEPEAAWLSQLRTRGAKLRGHLNVLIGRTIFEVSRSSQMKLALIGATGRVGSRVVAEALSRGHEVTAIARQIAGLKPTLHLVAKTGDASNPTELAKLLSGHDAVVSAVRFANSDPRKLIDAVKMSGVKRYVIVGGAGSLEVSPGTKLLDTPDFPPAFRAEAVAGDAFLSMLRKEPELEWSFLSPSATFAPGARTGKFRLGQDQLLIDPQGKSSISMEDFAIALVDELEHPQHIRQRFTVGY